MKTTKTTIRLKEKFTMTKQEVYDYEALPDNMPETKLNSKQEELVNSLYYKYLTPIDNQSWGASLERLEMTEKWPSGSRMKAIQAKRICLNALTGLQQHKKMSGIEAAKYFFVALRCRPSYQRVISEVFTVND